MAITTVQTFALSGHIIEDTGNLLRVGPESAAQFLRVRDATVTYQVTTGGPTYTDTVPGLQAAVVYGSSPAVTTVDARLARYVTFIVPAYGGVAPLQVATESYFNYLCAQGYVVPLDICYLHHWNYYQNTGGVALAPPGGSVRGGGSYGAFDTQSINGGGSVSGFPFTFAGPFSNGASQQGFVLRAPTAPASDTALLDFDFGGAGYYRFILDTSGRIRIQCALSTTGYPTVNVDLDITQGTPIPHAQWLWVAGENSEFNGSLHIGGSVTGGGGTFATSAGVNGSNAGGDFSLLAVLGVGVAHNPAYNLAPFPRTAGWNLSKIRLVPTGAANNSNALLGQPGADWPAGGGGATYNCRDAIGVVTTTLMDSSGGGYNLTPAAGGLEVTAEGPFA